MTRDERQQQNIDRWLNNSGRGILLACTGYGKTRTIIKSINYVKLKDITIIVPTIYLKQQWEEQLQNVKIKSKVLVINTACKMSFETDYLVIDEVHTACADEFSSVLTNIKSKYFIGVTATVREDEKWNRVLKKAPIIDEVTLEEALENEWVANYNIYKVPITLTSKEKAKLKRINTMYDKYSLLMKEIHRNPMKGAEQAIIWINIKKTTKNYRISKHTDRLYSINNLLNPKKYLISLNTGILYSITSIKKKYKEWNRINRKDNPIDYSSFREVTQKDIDSNFRRLTKEEVYELFTKARNAQKYYKYVRERKTLLYNAEHKITITNHLLEVYKNNKTIVFGKSIDFLYKLNHNDCFYHSKITKKVNKLNIKNFIEDKTNAIFSAQALEAGVDIKGVDIGIMCSYSSTLLSTYQKIGRVIRKEKDKVSNIFILYCPDTQEEVWLDKALGSQKTEIRKYG